MFRRFHEKLQEKEGGFTLIELLVVILIIAILAAIAIPVFLKQREKGWTSQSESALKNAATAMESYATANNGDYSDATEVLLEDEGFNEVEGVTVTITAGMTDTDEYCLNAVHIQGVDELRYDSDGGKPDAAACVLDTP
jgi:type IV pilus assembly protein PilA